jgi:energy-converting hydrogenase Eha subunit E
MLAAVKAERAEAAARAQEHAAGDRTTELPRLARPPESATSKEAGPETSSPASGTNGTRNGAAAAEPAVRAEPVAKARTIAGPEAAVRPGPDRRRRRAGARLVALGLAIIVIGSLAAVAVKHFSRSPTAARVQAAAWVAEQVSPDVSVSCDVVMCAALEAHGFPVGKLVVLGPASPDPVPSVLVVETAAVRELFGSSLAITSAPVVLASFGSGSGAITVRVVAPHGAAAYQASLNADLVDRKASGAALLKYSRVTVSAMAKSQLVAGQVDSRLLLALALLAGSLPVDIVRFGNLGPGASPGVPLRFADLAESVPAAHMDSAAYARAAWAVLGGVDARVRPARAVSGPVQGQAILRVEFAAPSPLGKSGSG